MSKKIGIFTIIGYVNYGNRLQNYAVQEVLRNLGYCCETITKIPINIKISKNIKEVLSTPFLITIKVPLYKFKVHIKNVFNRVRINSYPYNLSRTRQDIIIARKEAMRKFTENYIVENVLSNRSCINSANFSNDYSAFIVGSDQVWNPNFGCDSNLGLLKFAPFFKRISYSASFGVSSIPEKKINFYKKNLRRMTHISVREEDGAKIVKELTGREVPVLIDPTMMLTKEQWLAISKPADSKPEIPYLLTYFLGEVSQQRLEYINQIAEIRNLEIVNMADINDELRYVAGPDEFIDYIASSEIFLTDSFHGVVFSILFEKPFVVFERLSKTSSSSMYSRIDTLLSKFKLENRKAELIEPSEGIFSIDYSHVPAILEIERKKALDYLTNALKSATESGR